MKNVKSICLIIITLLAIAGCNNAGKSSEEKIIKEAMASNEDKDLTGTFTADGKTFTGRVSVQQFETTGEFSVLCQDNEGESTLLQTFFSTEADARTPGDLKVMYRNAAYGNKEVRAFSVSFETAWRTTDESKGTAKITKDGSNNVLEFEGVEVTDDISHKGVKKIISGKIPF